MNMIAKSLESAIEQMGKNYAQMKECVIRNLVANNHNIEIEKVTTQRTREYIEKTDAHVRTTAIPSRNHRIVEEQLWEGGSLVAEFWIEQTWKPKLGVVFECKHTVYRIFPISDKP